jgi:hypothetical protein
VEKWLSCKRLGDAPSGAFAFTATSLCRLNGKVASTSCEQPAGQNKSEYVAVLQGMLAARLRRK